MPGRVTDEGFELVEEPEADTPGAGGSVASAAAPKAAAAPRARAKGEAAAKAAPAPRTVRDGRNPRTVAGPHPIAPSATGRSYYLFLHPPRIVGGSARALAELGGSWVGHAEGRSPEGFSTIIDALNEASRRGLQRIEVIW